MTVSPNTEQAILTIATLAAALVALWLAASVVGWAIALRHRRPPSTTWRRIAAPGTRRWAETLLGASAFLLAACSPSTVAPRTAPTLTLLETATTNRQPTIGSSTMIPSSTTPSPTTSSTTTPSSTSADVTTPTTSAGPGSPAPEAPQPAPEQSSTTYVVQPGDNLWSIAHGLAEEANGTPPTTGETGIIWRVLIEMNRHHIASGDVDLIHPGEELILPGPTSGPWE